MTNKSTIKGLVTKLKNRIINALHETDIVTLIKIAEILNIKVSTEITKMSAAKKEQDPD